MRRLVLNSITMPVKRAQKNSPSASIALVAPKPNPGTTDRAVSPRSQIPQTKSTRSNRKRQEAPAIPRTSKKARIMTPEAAVYRVEDSSGSKGSASKLERPADPHRTNVPVITPKGSRLVSYTVDSSPSKTGLARPKSTTGHILEEACAHLMKEEPRLQPLIEQHYCRVFCPEGLREECDPFKSLCSTIMGQQVSGAAAMSIRKKFVGLFQNATDMAVQDMEFDEVKKDEKLFPLPAQVAACTVPFLRQAGLSERKAEYIKGLAEKFASGELSAAMLLKATDEEVLEKLTTVRGLGRWSVEMFACFGLKRMDIFSTGDLGVQ